MAENTNTYRGNCHCANFVFEFSTPEITAGNECNCSICYKKGMSWVFPTENHDFKLVKGKKEDLAVYSFGEAKAVAHYFCPTCGTAVYSVAPGDRYAVSLRAIQGVDIWSLPVKMMNGAAFGENKYLPAPFKGQKPTAPVPDGVIHTGACHCGAVTFALKTFPLDANHPGFIVECNCSIDRRVSAVWTYPMKSQVVVDGAESLTDYSHDDGDKDMYISFCKFCGTTVRRVVVDKPIEQYGDTARRLVQVLPPGESVTPVNIRLLSDFTIEESGVKVIKHDGWRKHEPQYVNP